MKYDCKKLGEELKSQLMQGYDPIRIARKFFDIYQEVRSEKDSLVKEVAYDLCLMEADPQMELSEEQLKKLCAFLCQNCNNQIKSYIDSGYQG